MNFAAALSLFAAATALAVSGSLAGENLSDNRTPDQDPYLWLEEVESAKALDWAKVHNEKSLARLTKDPRYAAIEAETRKILLATDRIPVPDYQGGFVYNFWQDAKHVRGLWRRTSLASYSTASPEWETVLDLDELAKKENENWVWHGYQCLAPDYKRCLLSLSRGGKDASVLREFDITMKEFLPPAQGGFALAEAKSSATWLDRDTLLVGTDFGPGSMTKSGYPRIVKRWKRGTPLPEAKQIFEGSEADVAASASTHFRKEGTVAVLRRAMTFFTEAVWILRPDGKTDRIELPEDADFRGVYQGQVLALLRSEWKVNGSVYPAGSLIAVGLADIAKPKPEIIYAPTAKTSVAGIADTEDALYVSVLDNVNGRVYRATRTDSKWSLDRVPFPDSGTVRIVTADSFAKDILINYESYLKPSTVYVSSGAAAPKAIKQLPERFDASGMVAEQFEAKSADGTVIPYFVIRKAGVRADGTNPTLLYGYGGFEVPMVPSYLNQTGKVWVDRGGIYVVANIRGGGEFGPKWHEAVLKENRPKVFEDFISVAEDLVRRKLTSPAHLAIAGGSNGGLLVGATFVKRPDLFKAVFCAVPLLDMLRYHKLLAGNSWMAEFGDPDDPKVGPVIRSYSPYQNVRAGVKYPSIFFFTSTKDDRVHPGHARKMVARMEEQGHPVLYFENIEGGHSASANLEQRVRMLSLQYTYLLQELQGAPSGAHVN